MKISVLMIFLFIFNSHLFAKERMITLGITEACPFMCPDNANKGFAVDITKAALKIQGYYVKTVSLPWARGLSDSEEGKINGVISGTKLEMINLIIPKEEIGIQRDCFFGLATADWKVQNIDSLKGHNSIAFKGWSFENELISRYGNKEYKKFITNFSIDEFYMPRVVQLIEEKRYDSFWYEPVALEYFLKNKRPDLEKKIVNLGCVKEQKLYIGLTKSKLSKTIAEDFDRGIKKIKLNGVFKEILKKYQVNEW